MAPNVVIQIRRMETLPQIKSITSGLIDIGFMRRMFSYPVGIEAFGLPVQRFRLVLREDHPLAKQKRITAATR